MTKNAHAEVTVEYSLTQSSRRIFSLCSVCKQVLAEGKWALDGQMFGVHFLIGPNPRPICCGQGRYVPFLFETPGAAQDKMNEVCKEIAEHKTHLVYNYYGIENFIPKHFH